MDLLSQLSSDLKYINKEKVSRWLVSLDIKETAAQLGHDTSTYDNSILAGRLVTTYIKRNAPKDLKEFCFVMGPRLNPQCLRFIENNIEELQQAINELEFKEYDQDWFSANTYLTTYLSKELFTGQLLETIHMMYLRVAVALFRHEGIAKVIETFKDIAHHKYVPASPGLFNASMAVGQMASCFLLTIGDDLEKIFEGVKRVALISKGNGASGVDVSNIRHSEIANDGMSAGIIPMIQIYNDTIRYVDQRGKRKGACTLFLRPHHIDIFDFISLSEKFGERYIRAHDVNTAVWFPWLFFKRLAQNDKWTLFCPAKTPKLNKAWGLEFEKYYVEYENDPNIPDNAKRVVLAKDLYDHMLEVQGRTSMPYVMHGDACNAKSNHRRPGRYIGGANLCLEIIEYREEDDIASCNLHSISLKAYVKGKYTDFSPDDSEEAIAAKLREAYDFDELGTISAKVTVNLNNLIKVNDYPLDKRDSQGNVIKMGTIHKTNLKDAPIGIGASGYAEMLYGLDLAFEDKQNVLLNKMVFACIYFNALAQSVQLAILHGKYATFEGSPFSEGKLQFDLWAEEFQIKGPNKVRCAEDDIPVEPAAWGQKTIQLYDSNGIFHDTIEATWNDLKRCIMKYGTANSLLTCLQPTATVAHILRNSENVEAPLSNLYSREVLKGSYHLLNRYLEADLRELNLWNNYSFDYLRVTNGSLKSFDLFVKENLGYYPEFVSNEANLKRLERIVFKFKGMYELDVKWMLKLTADRGRYIDNSQSTNIYIKKVTKAKLSALHKLSEMFGNKTGMYYLRQEPETPTINFTVNPVFAKYVRTRYMNMEPENQATKETGESSGGIINQSSGGIINQATKETNESSGEISTNNQVVITDYQKAISDFQMTIGDSQLVKGRDFCVYDPKRRGACTSCD